MARDPNWSPDADAESRARARERLRQNPATGPVMRLADTVVGAYNNYVVPAGQRYRQMFPDDPAPAPAPSTPSKPIIWNPTPNQVPSAMDLPDDPRSGIAGTFSGRNGLRVISREQADAAEGKSAPAPIDTSDTTDYRGITRGARQGIRSATLAARGDATRFLRPGTDENEIMRRVENATGSYFNKGFTGSRNAQVAALLGQLGAGNDVSAAGAEAESNAELAGAGAQFQSGLDDRNARNTAALGLRGSGQSGPDFGDMIDLMQLEETRRANQAREGEAARGRTQSRVDELMDFDPEKNPNGLNKSDPNDRAVANFLALSEEDPAFASSEEGQQLERRFYYSLLDRIQQNSSFFSPDVDARRQVSGPATGLRNIRIDPNDSVGWRNLWFDDQGSIFFRNPNGDEVGAPLAEMGLSPAEIQFLQEASARYNEQE